MTKQRRLGVHTSIAGGISRSVKRAAALGCTTMQIFSHSPRQWKMTDIPEEELGEFTLLREKHDIHPLFVHVSYLINLASSSDATLKKSVSLLAYELANARLLGADYVILHTGSAAGQDEKSARKRAARALREAAGKADTGPPLLLENTAGRKGDITSSVEALSELMEACSGDTIGGICLDTCHAFSAGYDITSLTGTDRLLTEIETYLGLENLKAIHLNDSQRPVGTGVDRHAHIGKGHIGLKGFRNLLSDRRVSHIPLILETPRSDDSDDRRNLRKIRTLLRGVS